MSVFTDTAGHPRGAVARCVNVTKYYGGVRALRDVSVDLFGGEVTALVGENGAGKSTLVAILSGIVKPDDGAVWYGDRHFTQTTPRVARDHGVETVYQMLHLCDNLGAAANVVLGQEPVRFRLGPIRFVDQRSSLDEARRRLVDVGANVPDLDRPVRELSGGQRQAVAIARATVRGHRLMIFDEPTAALGVRQTAAALRLIRQISSQGVGVVVISHNLEQVFAVADRIVAMRLGSVTLDAPIADVTREEVEAAMAGHDEDDPDDRNGFNGAAAPMRAAP